MNRFVRRASVLGKSVGSFLAVTAGAFALYAGGVVFYVNDQWRHGTSRIYDPPRWVDFSTDQKQDIVSRRHGMIRSLRDLYEMKHEAAGPELIASVFSQDCVIEDPYYRFVGPIEIRRAFGGLHRHYKYISFTKFQPVHYEDAVIIKCERQFKTLKSKAPEPRILMSNLAVHLKVDEDGEEKIDYIADEWNCVSLVQPETHNGFLFSGSVAKLIRRAPSKFTSLLVAENKSFFNPLRLLEDMMSFVDDTSEKLMTRQVKTDDTNPESCTNHEQVFNAGIRKT